MDKQSVLKALMGIASEKVVDAALDELANNKPRIVDRTSIDYLSGFAAALTMLCEKPNASVASDSVSNFARWSLMGHRVRMAKAELGMEI